MENQTAKVHNVEQVREVKDFKVATSSDKWEGTGKHDTDGEEEEHSCWKGQTRVKAKDARPVGKEPLAHVVSPGLLLTHLFFILNPAIGR